MKNTVKSFLTIIALATISLCNMLNAHGELFLENLSGAPIYYQKKHLYKQANNESNQLLGYGARVRIDSILNYISYSLKIKSNSKYSLYTSLNNYIKKAKDLFDKESRFNLKGKNAILTIEPSKIGWNIKVHWENDSQGKQNSNDDFLMPEEQSKLNAEKTKDLLYALKSYVEQNIYDKTDTLITQNKNTLSNIFSHGQLTAIRAGSHPGADLHQKKSALNFVNQGIAKLQ